MTRSSEDIVYGRREGDKHIDVEFAGVALKLRNTWIALAVTIIPILVGGMWAAFEFYKDYEQMKEQIQTYVAPDLSGIEKSLAVALNKTDEAVEYTRDVKDDLRNDVIEVEKSLGSVERRIRETENENRVMVKEAQRWFDERTRQVDEKLQALESRLNKRVDRALRNALAEQ